MALQMAASYSLKIEDIVLTVGIDDSFSNIVNFESQDEYVCSMIHQHSHLGYELFFIDNNTFTLSFEDKKAQYNNCALCVPSHFSHLTFRKSGYRLLLYIEKKSEKGNSGFAKFIYDIFENKQPFTLETDSLIYEYLKELEEILYTQQNTETVESALNLIFNKLYRLNSESSKPKKSKAFVGAKSYLMEIDEMINNFNNDSSMQAIADSLCLSLRQASRTVHKYYNKSPAELLLERKLKAACRLLQYTDSTVAQVVELLDFSSESYFYSQFKKAYGCTPKEYKEKKNGTV